MTTIFLVERTRPIRRQDPTSERAVSSRSPIVTLIYYLVFGSGYYQLLFNKRHKLHETRPNMNNEAATLTQRQDSLRETFELFNLETNLNSSLLSYGLNLGFIERRPADDRLSIVNLNIYPTNENKLVFGLLIELIVRVGIFIPASNLIRVAIEFGDKDNDRDNLMKCFYIMATILHQVINFDETSMRTINRVLLCVAVTLFSLTKIDSKPCEDMVRFKQKIKRRLLTDYYLWCLMLAMTFVLTFASTIVINPERVQGYDIHFYQMALNCFVSLHLSNSMRIIGYGRLIPLIIGTPLLFYDVGDEVTAIKALSLGTTYLLFWLSDWREMVDWNHSMLCEAGICKILNAEPGNLKHKFRKAKGKFDEWRLEEGLDDDGWFMLLDAPTNIPTTPPSGSQGAPTSSRSRPNDTSAPATTPNGDHRQQVPLVTEAGSSEGHDQGADDSESRSHGSSLDEGQEAVAGGLLVDEDNEMFGRLIDFSDRVIYLPSRNPLLTSLAAIVLIVWK